ncbi:MAG TPA: 3'-5' exonuclease [Methanosarcina sp.]|nr:3'-5' exonuclease [Methanosarcina sp.]
MLPYNELHWMIDLETLGTNDNCIVIQAGLVLFDPTTDYICKERSRNFLLDTKSQSRTRDINHDTLIWWLETNPTLLASLLTSKERTPVRDFLTSLRAMMYEDTIKGVWANSPSFDLDIIKSLYDQAGHDLYNPISFRKERDVRTIKDLAKVGIPETEAEMVRRGFEVGAVHNAYYDAIFQSVQVQLCYRKLGLSVPLSDAKNV